MGNIYLERRSYEEGRSLEPDMFTLQTRELLLIMHRFLHKSYKGPYGDATHEHIQRLMALRDRELEHSAAELGPFELTIAEIIQELSRPEWIERLSKPESWEPFLLELEVTLEASTNTRRKFTRLKQLVREHFLETGARVHELWKMYVASISHQDSDRLHDVSHLYRFAELRDEFLLEETELGLNSYLNHYRRMIQEPSYLLILNRLENLPYFAIRFSPSGTIELVEQELELEALWRGYKIQAY